MYLPQLVPKKFARLMDQSSEILSGLNDAVIKEPWILGFAPVRNFVYRLILDFFITSTKGNHVKRGNNGSQTEFIILNNTGYTCSKKHISEDYFRLPALF